MHAGGIAAPILVMGPVPRDALAEAVAAGLETALWDPRGFAARLAAAAKKQNRRAAIHLKVNADLNRLGLDPAAVRGAVEELDGHPSLALAGIFSHLAAAEEIDSPYTTISSKLLPGRLQRPSRCWQRAGWNRSVTSRHRPRGCSGPGPGWTWCVSGLRSTV